MGSGDIEEGAGRDVEEVVEDEGVDVEEGLWICGLVCHGLIGGWMAKRRGVEGERDMYSEEIHVRASI